MISSVANLIARRRAMSVAPPFTPANLPAGRVLRWYQGRALTAYSAADDGTGAVAAGGTAGGFTDLSAAADRARQATSERRPRVRRHPKGRGTYLEGSATAGTGGNFLASGSSVAGIKHAWLVATVIGPNNNRNDAPAPGKLFQSVYRGFLGTAPVATGAVLFTGDIGTTGTDNWLQASLTEYAKNGEVIAVASANVGLGRTRTVYRVKHTSTADAGALNLLRHVGYDGFYAYGGLHEVLVGSVDLTPTEIGQIDTYMMDYWLGGPCVVFTGDSLMAGFGLLEAQGPAALVAEHFEGTVPVPCIAVPGQGLFDSTSGVTTTMLVDDEAKLTALKHDHSPFIAVALAGTNDLATAQGRTGAQVYADLQTYAAMVHALGGLVIGGTIAVRSDGAWSAGSETERGAFNTLIRADHSFLDGFVDVDAINPTRQVDDVHWTVAGTQAVVDNEGGILDRIDALITAPARPPVIHVDLSVAGSRWQDLAGTTPSSAGGDSVRRVDDQADGGRHMLLGGASVPTLSLTSGGDGTKPALLCTGGSFLASVAPFTSRACTLVYVGQITSGGAVGHTPPASVQGDYLFPGEAAACRGALQLGGITFATGAWHVYVLRIEPGGALPRRLWVDGVEVGSSALSIGTTPLAGKLILGALTDAGAYFGTNETGEVRVYDRPLPPAEIVTLSTALEGKWAI